MEPGCGCELVFVEKVVMPDSRILMWQVDRIDPLPNGDAAGGDVPMAPELTSAEQIAAAAQYFDLFRAGIQTLLELGVPLPALMTTVETTATAMKVEPVEESAPTTSDTAIASNTEPTEPAKPKPPSVDEAF